MTLPFDMIVAVARNGVIGFQGDMPWHVPEDLKHFKSTTQGHPVLMGRKTWESLPFKPLPKRVNLVLTRDRAWHAKGAYTVTSVQDVQVLLQQYASDAESCFIMGGATLYKMFYEVCRYIWVTRLDIAPEGDTWFELPENLDFTLLEKSSRQTSVTGVNFQIEKWGRV